MPKTNKITAILWDFGGVITASPFEAFSRYEAAHALPRDFIRTINASNPDDNAWARFERSEIDAAAFDSAFLHEARGRGHEVRGRDVLALLAGDIRPEMVALLHELKAQGFRLACITNNVNSGAGVGMVSGAKVQEKTAAVADVMRLFEHVFESSKIGIRKPDPAIYTLAAETLGVAPENCVFLDDLGVNLKPAAALGMTTIKVVSAAQAISDLRACLEA